MKARNLAAPFALLVTIACGPADPPGPCDGALALALVDDAGVPDLVKSFVLYDTGPLIGPSEADYPSGKVVVVRISTPDYPANPAADATYLRRILFGSDPSQLNVAGYFAENSAGLFDVSEGAIPDWTFMNSWTTASVAAVEGNATRAAEVLRATSIGWSALDTNQDGRISRSEAQIVFLIPNYAPPPNAVGFASKRDVALGNVPTPGGTFDFGTRPIVYFSVARPGFAGEPIRGALPAVNHELGHGFFDMIDRYGPINYMGNYEMMSSFDSNVWVHFTAQTKIKLGWWQVRPRFVVGGSGKKIKLPPESLGGYFLVVLKPESVQPPYNVDEYWVVTHRRRNAGRYEAQLPEAGGLAVYHVKRGAFTSGHDRVVLLDNARPDGNPTNYVYSFGSTDALFKARASVVLFKDTGATSGITVKDVLAQEDFACATF